MPITLLQDWERCERGIGGSLEKLRAFKRQLSQPLPHHHEDLQTEQMHCKVYALIVVQVQVFCEQNKKIMTVVSIKGLGEYI